MPEELMINKEKTSLVVIDLQKGITSLPVEPFPVNVVIDNTVKLLNASRKNNIQVFLVHVASSADMKDRLQPIAETSFQIKYNPDWGEFVSELNVQPEDFIITKHQWGAFYGTELDLQLRRRKIDTIILCGIAANFGVESTARFAYEYGYNQIFVSDAISARSIEEYEYPLKYIFPRLGLIRSTKEILKALK